MLAARGFAGSEAEDNADIKLSFDRGTFGTMTDFVFVPRGPFSLARSADVIANFPPLRHQPANGPGVVRIGFIADREHRPVVVSLRKEAWANVIHGRVAGSANIDAIRKQVARIFGLDRDATPFAALGKRDAKLAPLLAEFDGLRPVSFTSPYECACWGVVSQRISTDQATGVIAELARSHGETIELEGEATTVFPSPERLLAVTEIPGLASVKVERLHAIARAALAGELDADVLGKLSEEEATSRLRELPGIGPFWASLVWFRACGVVEPFPSEPISLAALGALHGLGDRPAAADVARITEAYRPFGMWVAFLLRVAAARGSLPGIAGRHPSIRRSSRSHRRTSDAPA